MGRHGVEASGQFGGVYLLSDPIAADVLNPAKRAGIGWPFGYASDPCNHVGNGNSDLAEKIGRNDWGQMMTFYARGILADGRIMCITGPVIVQLAIGWGWLKWWGFRDWLRGRVESVGCGLPCGGGGRISGNVGAMLRKGVRWIGAELDGKPSDYGVAGVGAAGAQLLQSLPADADGAGGGGVAFEALSKSVQESFLFHEWHRARNGGACKVSLDSGAIECDYSGAGGAVVPALTLLGDSHAVGHSVAIPPATHSDSIPLDRVRVALSRAADFRHWYGPRRKIHWQRKHLIQVELFGDYFAMAEVRP